MLGDPETEGEVLSVGDVLGDNDGEMLGV